LFRFSSIVANTSTDTTCAGAGFTDVANLSNIFVTCGLLRGAPRRVDGGSQLLFEENSRWSSSLHSCAATVRATIKTVSFSVNGTDTSLARLVVNNITEKVYATGSNMPVWGVENSGMSMDGINPIWGLISPDHKSNPNVSSTQQPSLYLVGYSGPLAHELSPVPTPENIPASIFPVAAMNTVFGAISGSWPFDMVGRSSVSVFTRWQNLSQNAVGASTIVDLLWTDLAASAVVGTKGVLGHGNSGPANETTTVMIQQYSNRVKYYTTFGIPAYVLIIVLVSATLCALGTMVFGRSSIAKVRLRLQQVSVGRVLTTLLYPGYSSLRMSAKDWTKGCGDQEIDLGGTSAMAKGKSPMKTFTGGEGDVVSWHQAKGSNGGIVETTFTPNAPSLNTPITPRSSESPRSNLREVENATGT
jgi:hypothetical protein